MLVNMIDYEHSIINCTTCIIPIHKLTIISAVPLKEVNLKGYKKMGGKSNFSRARLITKRYFLLRVLAQCSLH